MIHLRQVFRQLGAWLAQRRSKKTGTNDVWLNARSLRTALRRSIAEASECHPGYLNEDGGIEWEKLADHLTTDPSVVGIDAPSILTLLKADRECLTLVRELREKHSEQRRRRNAKIRRCNKGIRDSGRFFKNPGGRSVESGWHPEARHQSEPTPLERVLRDTLGELYGGQPCPAVSHRGRLDWAVVERLSGCYDARSKAEASLPGLLKEINGYLDSRRNLVEKYLEERKAGIPVDPPNEFSRPRTKA